MKTHHVLLVALTACLTASIASAENVKIRCGSQNFVVDTQANLLITDKQRHQVAWKYDGEWIRLEFAGSGLKLAFSSKSGYVLQDERKLMLDTLA